jgi:CRP-like cAMP-binding protein
MEGLPILKQIMAMAECIDPAIDAIKVMTHVGGSVLLRQGDPARGIHILVQGDVDLRNDSVLSHKVRTEAPSAILQEDIIDVDSSRAFVLKGSEDEVTWSRTVTVPVDEKASTLAMTLFLPYTLLLKVSGMVRYRADEEVRQVIESDFVPITNLPLQLCLKHFTHFKFKTVQRNHLLVHNGALPQLSLAAISIILDGEVVLLAHSEINTTKRRRMKKTISEHGEDVAVLTAGAIIGEEALYGEPYSATALVRSESVRVLSVPADVYIEKLLNKKGLLIRAQKSGGAVKKHARIARIWSLKSDDHDATGSKADGAEGDIDNCEDERCDKPRGQQAVAAEALYAAMVKRGRIARDKQKLAEESPYGLAASPDALPGCKRVAPPDETARRQQKSTLLMHQLNGHQGNSALTVLDEVDLCYPPEFCWSPKAQQQAIHLLRKLPSTSKSRASTCSTRAATSSTMSSRCCSSATSTLFESVSPEHSRALVRPFTSMGMSQIDERFEIECPAEPRAKSQQGFNDPRRSRLIGRASRGSAGPGLPCRAPSVAPCLDIEIAVNRTFSLQQRPPRVVPIISDPPGTKVTSRRPHAVTTPGSHDAETCHELPARTTTPIVTPRASASDTEDASLSSDPDTDGVLPSRHH